MAYLEAKNLGHEFTGVTALNNVDIALELGRVHILAGENGAGKSTLVKLLTGAYAPSRGTLSIDGRDPATDADLFRTIAYVPQELSLFPHMSVAENLFLPYSRTGHGGALFHRRKLEVEAQDYLDRFGIRARPTDLVRTISVPDQQLLQIARASTNKDMKVLFLDEPTSSLTPTEVERVFKVIGGFRDAGLAIVFISHKMDEVFAIGDDYTVLRNGEKVAAGRICDTDVDGLIQAMSGEILRLGTTFHPEAELDRSGGPILEVNALTGRQFSNASFKLERGEILGFAGLVGAGRSELMQTIFGFRKATSGSVHFCGEPLRLGDPAISVKAGMIYLSEERKHHGIFAKMSLRDNIGMAIYDQTSGFSISARKEKAAVADVIAAYGIKTSSSAKEIRHLSGGNQQKAIIGRAMARRPKLIIFDEPTKGIDVRTKTEIYRIMKTLAEDGIGIILISSEMAELRKCATRIIAMHSGVISGEFITATTDNETLVGAIFGAKGHKNVA
ncbi:sugar ABC transporter ATP-binding protein [Segnochrobactrum spirostomi]|uniref:Autoinducer 2 import ATP-binding protein LsrA n=1 Tax=Segnochrobactrum spirostomi TaxID=2608987 RepID=A0A6A7Y6K3_9HYPH|nr:sugar ABC transporter ATP-binding protein [Segnochrobactrum spirostomi]MQT14874.1 sugar ABC transporter ATP-binding protein [Segnochrobactrum spirostomi]